ncbi:MAG: DUF2911 domain-containing protein, partial [Acidobacteriota bacterium]
RRMMKRAVLAVAFAATALAVGATVHAQKITQVHPGKAGSPHVREELTVDGANISIEYGRPSLKGRVPGKDIDPYDGREWRTGADEATTLKTDKALQFGTLLIPAGTYTLYTIPTGGTWHLIISKKSGQWGIPYPQGEDLGRVPMTLGKAPKAAEMLTISLQDTPAGGTLRIEWGGTRASIPFTVG